MTQYTIEKGLITGYNASSGNYARIIADHTEKTITWQEESSENTWTEYNDGHKRSRLCWKDDLGRGQRSVTKVKLQGMAAEAEKMLVE